jgi:hypothetical protein
MALNTQIFIQSKASNQGKQCKIHQRNENTPHTSIVEQKRIQTNIVKTIIIFIFTSNKTNTQKLRNSRGKKTEDVLGNFMKLSSLFDESNYYEHATTQQASKPS